MAAYLITGASGLIGQALCQRLLNNGETVFALSRNCQKTQKILGPQVHCAESVAALPVDDHIDIVINLAGAPIVDKRWTDQRKQLLLESRVTYTQDLIQQLSKRSSLPHSFISGSAVGWYGNQGETILTEDSDFEADFSHELCDQWEKAALSAESLGMRVAIVRTGLVVSPSGGFLSKMLLPFKMGLGGPISDGRQYMPWIHIDDICRLFLFLAENRAYSGVFNGSAPRPVTNQQFSEALAETLHRPAFFRVPACVLKTAMGEMADLLLGGQRAIPEKAQASGFEFLYTDIQSALSDVLNSSNKK
ncbi:TIGR01777 family protein [Methylophaga sp. SB9B]|uniref:TIGR01777 family oxidoreductase n=1 Tax=Methylophaga sp. SB9B TaxID=2570356 RepID=UPI0010A8730A|nr:TIGR01777 family oxidoreductase [Methylophaga sp. SB9B]THK41506.1 TIGR01777 family protein [Methylophaga sp. SB9B]